jgi:hypothetical protein
MTGSESQIQWAEQIRPRVDAEFSRVAAALAGATEGEGEVAGSETRAILSILEEKRAEVMAHDQAGYYIRDWQELGEQVRRLIHRDPRYAAIRAGREARSLRSRAANEAA